MDKLAKRGASRDLVSLRDMMDRLFEDSFVRPTSGWFGPVAMSPEDLAIDMYETKEDVVVKAALPGVKPENLDVTISGDILSIKGESEEESTQEEQDYIRKERRFGTFSRSVSLPSGLQADKAEAKFENGMLTLKIPKTEQSKPKTIKVKSA